MTFLRWFQYKYEVCPESIGPTFISPPWRYSSSSGGWHPSKSSPLDWITRFQRCFHFSKQSWNSLLGMDLSTLVALFSTAVLSSNRCPLSGFLSFGNSQKSQGAMSGLYGGCRSNAILCLLRNFCTRFDECAAALSWWRSQSPHTRESFLKSCSKSPKQ